MSQNLFVSMVEARLRERRIAVAELCRSAAIATSTWQRWKSGSSHPRESSKRTVTAALDTLLAQQPAAPIEQMEAAE